MIRTTNLTLLAVALGTTTMFFPVAGEAGIPVLNSHAVAAIDGTKEIARRGRGADDGPNHHAKEDRGRRGRDGGKGRGRGADDGPNHH